MQAMPSLKAGQQAAASHAPRLHALSADSATRCLLVAGCQVAQLSTCRQAGMQAMPTHSSRQQGQGAARSSPGLSLLQADPASRCVLAGRSRDTLLVPCPEAQMQAMSSAAFRKEASCKSDSPTLSLLQADAASRDLLAGRCQNTHLGQCREARLQSMSPLASRKETCRQGENKGPWCAR